MTKLNADERTQSNLDRVSCHHHSFVDISDFCPQLLGMDQSIRCMLCYDTNAQSAFCMLVAAVKKDNNHVPAVLCTALLPRLLVLFFVTHYDLLLQKQMFRIVKLVLCCHEGRGSKMAEVCAFSADLAVLRLRALSSLCAQHIALW